ncbi:MAG: DNA mismatch repair protein [Oscillospiraceae bacterium]|nr:DNA mismatch repair protein [Oscillospiraceae bacterium]
MNDNKPFSLLYPDSESEGYRKLSESACHDLALDVLCVELTEDKKEQNMIMNVISKMTASPETAEYRKQIFSDILDLPELRKKMSELFDKIEYIRKFGSSHIDTDEKLGFWHLMHRLDELDDYIKCVEAMKECLSDNDIRSEGLISFRKYVDDLYNEACFAEMKKDITELKKKSSDIQSVTLGINVNDRFEAVSMGLVSVNSKPFRKSNIVSSFADAIASKNRIHEGCEWNGDMHYHQIEKAGSGFISNIQTMGAFTAVTSNAFVDGAVRSTVVNSPEGDNTTNSTWYLDNIMNKILDSLVKKLRDVLTKYSNIAVVNISGIMPEFVYYIRLAEFIEKKMKCGFRFCEPKISENETVSMKAKDLYNLRLALTMEKPDDIVYNDLDFDKEHSIYILTGANRGGKTTITQAVGLMFVLAQGGIYVPASEFIFKPADCIYTHFPADEDKTLDLGRLGEECVRFKDIYSECTENSLVLLNETFSTTSFEEGYYIARDSVRALLKKQVRAIYNTHMHKLAESVEEMNAESTGVKASSLIMKNENGKRSFKVEIAAPEGSSYAKDIAEKYGVTYEMLTGGN